MKRPSRQDSCTAPLRRLPRALRGTALTALCAVALAACGTERPAGGDGDGGDSAGKPAAGSRAAASSPAPSLPDDVDADDTEFLPFMELLNSVAEPCVRHLLPSGLPTEPVEDPLEEQSAEKPPTEPLPELAVPEEPPPPSEPRDPEAARKETELSSIEKCAARNHERRITEAFGGMTDPTPRQVRTVLHRLGYIDQRIHGPRRSGDAVEFVLDLRSMGGELCQSGRVGGTGAAVESYGGSVEVGCTDVKRRR
ncbi:hypothetical protein ACIBU0_07015 [Streptomyces sp. NPDC049627]|uniref:hypothetical protein n=1 Tax=Streptomyces sp. NPDC049627 TaxID=3365595 RepID=UPI0037ACF4B6